MELTAEIALIEDRDGRRGDFVTYCKGRKDIRLHLSSFAGDESNLIETTSAELDCVCLDIRLPLNDRDQKDHAIEDLSTRGCDIARKLFANPNTRHIPVVIYTQYATHPAVITALTGIERCKNVVRVFDCVPLPAATIDPGLRAVRRLALNAIPNWGQRGEFTVTGRDLAVLQKQDTIITLNGEPPCDNKSIGLGTVVLSFPLSAVRTNWNYLMVKEQHPKKRLPHVPPRKIIFSFDPVQVDIV